MFAKRKRAKSVGKEALISSSYVTIMNVNVNVKLEKIKYIPKLCLHPLEMQTLSYLNTGFYTENKGNTIKVIS